MEALLRNKRYAEFLRNYGAQILDNSFEAARSESKSGYDSLIKLQGQISDKLAGPLDQIDKPQTGTFDLSKLETLKEQGNKNFFDKMNNIKQGKKGNEGAKETKGSTDDFLELNLTERSGPTKTETKPTKKGDDLLDLDDFDVIDNNTNKGTNPVHIKKTTESDFDLLDTQFGDLSVKKPEVKTPQLNEHDFFAQTNITPTKPKNDDLFDLMGQSGNHINFNQPNAPNPPSSNSNVKTDSLANMMNFTHISSPNHNNNNGSKKQDQKDDPFDSIVF